MHRLALPAILAVVAVAFADSSIVVLALPALLHQFDTSVTEVAWVVTAYNLVLAVAALALIWLAPRLSVVRLIRCGCVVFLAGSLVCGLSGSLSLLIAFRGVQGLGGALVLVGALPLTGALARTPARGSAAWVGATVFGAAVGPACGGALTQLFSWHAIFLAQTPLPALALLATFVPLRRPLPVAGGVPGAGRWRLVALDAAVALESAALVGLLFVAVVLFVDVWRLSPIAAAAAVSVIPLATLAVQFVPARERKAVGAGILLFTAGLAGMAFLPATSIPWAVAALGIGGAGVGLAVPRLSVMTLAGDHDLARRAARATCVRHVGLVLGLLALTPVLAADLSAAGDRAQLEGVATVLDAPAPGGLKLQLALDLAPSLATPPRDGLPELTHELAPRGKPELTAIGRQLDAVVEATVTRAFREPFLLAGLFALLGLPFVRLAVADRPAAGVRRRPIALLAVALGVAAFLGAELARGALDYGRKPHLAAPCAGHAVPGGIVQRELLVGLDALACRLHTTREQLIVRVATTPLAAHLGTYIEQQNKLPSWLRDLAGSILRFRP